MQIRKKLICRNLSFFVKLLIDSQIIFLFMKVCPERGKKPQCHQDRGRSRPHARMFSDDLVQFNPALSTRTRILWYEPACCKFIQGFLFLLLYEWSKKQKWH